MIKDFFKNFQASLVVFLVSLPLFIAVAIASGAKPSMGLIAGIVGCIIVSFLGGSPLQVTGPAGGLIVITLQIVNNYGLENLGEFVLFAGIIQVLIGIFRLGPWFQSLSPSVIHGMLAGIGVIIFSSQIYLMCDSVAKNSVFESLISVPQLLRDSWLAVDSNQHDAMIIGIVTLLLIITVDRFPTVSKRIPSILIAVFVSVILTEFLKLDIEKVCIIKVPIQIINLPNIFAFKAFINTEAFLTALTLALICSIEALLTSSAIDRMYHGPKTKYNQEIIAQGIGNLISGFLGLLPMTGSIVKSSANFYAGATSKISSILAGVWVLIVTLFFAEYLQYIPKACLAGVLVYLSLRLINIKEIKNIIKFDKGEVFIYAITTILIVVGDILVGVVVGIILSFLKFLYNFSTFEFVTMKDPKHNTITVFLKGYPSFINLPKLSEKLHALPSKMNVHLNFSYLSYLDYSIYELLVSWEKEYVTKGGTVFIEWDKLKKGLKPFKNNNYFTS